MYGDIFIGHGHPWRATFCLPVPAHGSWQGVIPPQLILGVFLGKHPEQSWKVSGISPPVSLSQLIFLSSFPFFLRQFLAIPANAPSFYGLVDVLPERKLHAWTQVSLLTEAIVHGGPVSHTHSQMPRVVPPESFILLQTAELSDNPCVFFGALKEYFTTEWSGGVGHNGERTRKSSSICIINTMGFSPQIWQRTHIISNINHSRGLLSAHCVPELCQAL